MFNSSVPKSGERHANLPGRGVTLRLAALQIDVPKALEALEGIDASLLAIAPPAEERRIHPQAAAAVVNAVEVPKADTATATPEDEIRQRIDAIYAEGVSSRDFAA